LLMLAVGTGSLISMSLEIGGTLQVISNG
jgi:hypothetical protein